MMVNIKWVYYEIARCNLVTIYKADDSLEIAINNYNPNEQRCPSHVLSYQTLTRFEPATLRVWREHLTQLL